MIFFSFSEMIGRLVFAMGGRTAEELVFHEPTTGASGDIEQATKIARAMVTEYGMSARLGAVRYGQDHGDPFLGRSMGHAADYSIEVAREIDEEVRALVEAAHTEAWDILQHYRDVLDDLVAELVEKETLQRKDLARIFAAVDKRPRITAFNDFGGRTPSDKPPIKTPGELAKERGEPWPPVVEPEPTPVGAVPGGGLPQAPGGVGGPGLGGPGGPNGPGPNGAGPHQPQPGPPYGQPGPWPAQPAPPPQGPPYGGYPPPQDHPNTGPYPTPYSPPGMGGYPGQPGHGRGGPPNYGAPPDWRPATTPPGRPYDTGEPDNGERRDPASD